MRAVIRMYLTWQRLEIALVALLVPGLIVESSVANGWVYGGGTLTAISFLRGFFFEVVTYVTARQAFVLAGKKQVFGCVLMALTSLAAVYVSAVNNLGWVMAGHDLGGFFGTLGHVMGTGPLVRGYEFFLAVLLPLSVGQLPWCRLITSSSMPSNKITWITMRCWSMSGTCTARATSKRSASKRSASSRPTKPSRKIAPTSSSAHTRKA